jgi:lactose/L-arabinose transport system ATP-binding protein
MTTTSPSKDLRATIELQTVRKSFGTTLVIPGIDLSIDGGEFVVFVGPSGCGKSTLLRMIAGLDNVSGGEILIAGEPVTDLGPAQRGCAMVFQSYALYPHMTVRENLSYGLRIAKTPKAEIDKQVALAADILKIEALLDRRPSQLSGGQRQRVAIGRAIVRKPKVFLFDEPLSNLDAELRVSMRIEIAKLHKKLGNTMIYVTHDQTEAMTLADKIVVLHDGRIEQIGSPRDIYENPENEFVATFIGSPRMNILQAAGAADSKVTLEDHSVVSTVESVREGEPVRLGVRPEHLRVVAPEKASVVARIDHVEYLGSSGYIYCTTAGKQSMVVEVGDEETAPHTGETVGLGFDPASIRLFSSEGARLR